MRISIPFVLLLLLSPISAQKLRAQSGSIAGTVLVDPSEKPLAGAEIFLRDLKRSVRSDSAGNFVLNDLPFGKHVVIVRMVGFESVQTDVTLTNGKPLIEADLLLKPASTKLAEVEVKEAASPYAIRLQEFEERRKVGTGKFLTADFFEKNDGRPFSALLTEKIGGLKIEQTNGRRFLTSTRGIGNAFGKGSESSAGMEKRRTGCYVQVVVDGMVRYNGNGQLLFDLDQINTADVIGFEYYTTASTPEQYNMTRGSAACGTAVIWTK